MGNGFNQAENGGPERPETTDPYLSTYQLNLKNRLLLGQQQKGGFMGKTQGVVGGHHKTHQENRQSNASGSSYTMAETQHKRFQSDGVSSSLQPGTNWLTSNPQSLSLTQIPGLSHGLKETDTILGQSRVRTQSAANLKFKLRSKRVSIEPQHCPGGCKHVELITQVKDMERDIAI